MTKDRPVAKNSRGQIKTYDSESDWFEEICSINYNTFCHLIFNLTKISGFKMGLDLVRDFTSLQYKGYPQQVTTVEV